MPDTITAIPQRPLLIAIVPSAQDGRYDLLAGVSAARGFTPAEVDEMLGKLHAGDTVLYDCRRACRAA